MGLAGLRLSFTKVNALAEVHEQLERLRQTVRTAPSLRLHRYQVRGGIDEWEQPGHH